MSKPGFLSIVATPIGHLDDLSIRAKTVLTQAHYIAAEDTRHSQRLLQHYGIQTRLLSLHDHNEKNRLPFMIDLLEKGHHIALISDAGTPLIRDPGFLLVAECRKKGFRVEAIPGPCAAIAALSISGLPCASFVFEGFLPHKQQHKQQRLTELTDETRTMIFYISPHRVLADLEACIACFGSSRQAVLARELTKQFETVITGDLQSIQDTLEKDANQQRGEMVLLIRGKSIKENNLDEIDHQLKKTLSILLQECSLKQAVHLAVLLTGEKKNHVYQVALELKKDDR